MSITSFVINSDLLSAMSKAKKLETDQSERDVELLLFPKYTDAYIDSLEVRRDELIANYDYDGNLDGDDDIYLSPEFNALEDTDPFITSTKVWWGNDSTGIHVYLNLTQKYSTLDELELAFDQGLENNLFSRIEVLDQGKDVAKVIFNTNGFSITLAEEIKFAIDGKLPTTISEFESIEDSLTVISDYINDESGFSRSTLLYHLDVLMNYGVDEIYFEAFDNKLFSIFNTNTKAGVTLGGMEVAVNGKFPEINSSQALDFINYLKDTEDGDIDELLSTIDVTHESLTIINSNGINLITIDTHSEQNKLEDEIGIIENGMDEGLWIDSVPSDLFAYKTTSSDSIESLDSSDSSSDKEPIVSGATRGLTVHSADDSIAEVFDGEGNLDMVIFSTTHDQLVKTDDGYKVGEDTLRNIERVQFSDANIALDTEGATSAGGIYRLYKATFNREPDESGLGYWIAQADADNKDAVRMAEDFTWSAEFQNLYGIITKDNYGTGTDVRDLVTGFYENVLGRAPDAGGLNYYTGVIESHEKTVGRVLAEISDSPENYDATIELIQNGIQYDLWVG